MKQSLLTSIFIGIGALLLSGSIAQVSAKTIELSFSTGLPPFHVAVKDICVPWAKMVEERAKGKVKVDVHSGGSLCNAKQTLACIENGLVDIGYGPCVFNSDRFPLSTVLDLPLLGFSTAEEMAKAFWELYKKIPEIRAEYSDFHVLWLGARPLYQIQTIKKPVRTLEDLKGMKIRTSGGTSAMVPPKLGAVAVVLNVTDTYLSMERGIVDGSMFPWEGNKSFKLYEIVKYHTVVNLIGGGNYTLMNKDLWNSLSPDIQKVFDELGGEWATQWDSEKWDAEDVRGKELCIKAGNEIYTPPPEELKRWKRAVEPVWDEWVTKMGAKGLPGRKVLDETLKLGQ